MFRRPSNAIGIDASRALASIKTGTETYSYELLRALAALRPPDRFELYLNAATAPADFPALGRFVLMPFPRLWTHIRLSTRMALHPPGVLFIPAHVIPALHPPAVVVVHDLGYLHVPGAHPASTRRMLDLTTRWNAWAATHLIAISEATKRDLIESYGTPTEKITVVPHGASAAYHPRSDIEIAATLARLAIQSPYILAVGTYQPRKNFGRLAHAMRLVAEAGLPHKLVIAGKRGWLAEQVDAEIAASGQLDRIQTLGYVDQQDLPALYAGADVFCLPSLYEGFGMPVLEAMASGTPVVASNASALAEVAGSAAITVDPLDVGAIGAALVNVLTNAELSEKLRDQGLKRASMHTWERTAIETLRVLRSVRDGSSELPGGRKDPHG